jgi:hypothetical protein
MRKVRLFAFAAALGLAAGFVGAAGAQEWGPQDWSRPAPYSPYGDAYGAPGAEPDPQDRGYDDPARLEPVRWRQHAQASRARLAGALEAQVLAEINEARMHPQRYAARLRAYRRNYHGDVVREPGDEIGVRTNEGVRALDEAIADVERRRPLRPLAPNARLAASAARLAEGEGPTGVIGHVGPDGLTPGQRMKAAGVWAGITEENISFGQQTAAAVVRQLIIDDGVPGRGHRSSIFEPGLSAAGVSCGPHIRYGWMCVIDFAGAVMAQR